MGNKIKNFEAFNESVSETKITILSKNNELFHYDIYLGADNTVVRVDNQWDVKGLPVYMNMNFDMKLLKHYIQKKRPDFYIAGDN